MQLKQYDPATATLVKGCAARKLPALFVKADAVVAVGGDGTMLRVVRALAGRACGLEDVLRGQTPPFLLAKDLLEATLVKEIGAGMAALGGAETLNAAVVAAIICDNLRRNGNGA